METSDQSTRQLICFSLFGNRMRLALFESKEGGNRRAQTVVNSGVLKSWSTEDSCLGSLSRPGLRTADRRAFEPQKPLYPFKVLADIAANKNAMMPQAFATRRILSSVFNSLTEWPTQFDGLRTCTPDTNFGSPTG